jgi:RNA polymerase sigma-70 factor (ECF subfamily)
MVNYGLQRGKKAKGAKLRELRRHIAFEQAILPHMGAAYNLARWLTRNDQDAEDVTQDACLRALKFFEEFHGGNGRAWLLAIVRNTFYTWLRQNRARELTTALDEEICNLPGEAFDPEALLLQSETMETLRKAVEELPVEYREVVVLRDMEGLSYREIADVAAIPLGTVMSRLARARKRLQQSLAGPTGQGGVAWTEERQRSLTHRLLPGPRLSGGPAFPAPAPR